MGFFTASDANNRAVTHLCVSVFVCGICFVVADRLDPLRADLLSPER